MSNTILGPKGEAAVRQFVGNVAQGVGNFGRGVKALAQIPQDYVNAGVDMFEQSKFAQAFPPAKVVSGAVQGATQAMTGTVQAAGGMFDWSTPKALGEGANMVASGVGYGVQEFMANPVTATIEGATAAIQYAYDNASWHNVGELVGNATVGYFTGGKFNFGAGPVVGQAVGAGVSGVVGQTQE